MALYIVLVSSILQHKEQMLSGFIPSGSLAMTVVLRSTPPFLSSINKSSFCVHRSEVTMKIGKKNIEKFKQQYNNEENVFS